MNREKQVVLFLWISPLPLGWLAWMIIYSTNYWYSKYNWLLEHNLSDSSYLAVQQHNSLLLFARICFVAAGVCLMPLVAMYAHRMSEPDLHEDAQIKQFNTRRMILGHIFSVACVLFLIAAVVSTMQWDDFVGSVFPGATGSVMDTIWNSARSVFHRHLGGWCAVGFYIGTWIAMVLIKIMEGQLKPTTKSTDA